ncbi:MAG: DMT family transporter [Oscillospiraceae bacterium]|nr:DMT family transporter [Oscillospiraceae bacterium]
MKNENGMTKLKLEYLLLMCTYGCLGPVVRGISLPTIVIVCGRAVISAVTLFLVLIVTGRKHLKKCRGFLLPMMISGVFLAVDWIGLFGSYRYTTIATATLCYYVVPVLVILGAAAFLGEKLTARKLICSAVAFAGMVFVSGAAESGLPTFAEIKGVLLALLGALGYAAVILINRKYPEGDPLSRTFLQLCTAAVIMSAYVLRTTDLNTWSVDLKGILLLLFLGVVMTGFAYVLYFRLIVRISAQSVAFFSYADPVVAVLISVFLLREPFSVFTMAGAVMIIGAAIVVERQKQ